MPETEKGSLPRLDESRLRRLIEVGRGLVGELELDALLERLLEAAREITGARYAALGVLNERRDGLERFLHSGVDAATARAIGELPQGRGVLGQLISDPRPLRLAEVGSHPRSYGFPPGHPEMHSFLGVPVMIRGEAWGNLYLGEKPGAVFDEADEQAVLVVAEWAAIAIENARLYGDVRRRTAELERAVRGLEATTEIARAVGGETDLERVLATIAKRARALVEASSLVVLLEQRGELVVVVTAGELDRDPQGERLPLDSAWGRVMGEGVPERIDDLASRLGVSPAEVGARAAAALLVPLRFRGRPLGLIAAFDRVNGGPAFGPEHEGLLISAAASAATAVATAQSVAEDRLRHSIEASESERRRWARELHDETLQGLGVLRLKLSSAARSGSGEQTARALADAIEQLGTEISNLRALISELRPVALDELGLHAALQSLAEHHATTGGLEVHAEVDPALERSVGAAGLGGELESALYRVIQEALTNIAKHARAERVQIALTAMPRSVELLVRDDGVGFDPTADHGGFGLVGMRERVALLGGELEVSAAPGDGTELRASVPLPAGEARRAGSAGSAAAAQAEPDSTSSRPRSSA